MKNLITTLTESINFKLQEVEDLSKMINLAVIKDIKGMRKFILDHDTFERESFYGYLLHYDKEFFEEVYPHANDKKNIGMYVTGIIHKQFQTDQEEERKQGLEFTGFYPKDWCDEEYPDIIRESNRLSSAFAFNAS